MFVPPGRDLGAGGGQEPPDVDDDIRRGVLLGVAGEPGQGVHELLVGQPGAGVGPHQLEDPGVRVPGDGLEFVAFDLQGRPFLSLLDEGLEPGWPAFADDFIGRRHDVLARTAEEINAEVDAERVTFHSADLSRPEQVEPLACLIGDVDVIVNCAGGVDRAATDTLEQLRDSFDRDHAGNVLTTVLLTQALLPRLRRPGGRIVSVSSIAALRGGGDSYSASKAAVIGWTYQMAAVLGPDGITANVVAPGFIEDTEFFADTMTPERRQRLIDQTVVGRAGTPEDVAGAVRYLASSEASFVTGQVLQVNGGALFGR